VQLTCIAIVYDPLHEANSPKRIQALSESPGDAKLHNGVIQPFNE